MVYNIEKIWRQFYQVLLNFIQSKVSNKHDAEDILQNVFIKVYSNIDNLHSDTKLEAWIYQIARNAIIDYYRLKKQNVSFEDIERDLEIPIESKNMNKHISSCLYKMLDELPDKYQESLKLYEFKNLKHKEISQKLNISVSGSKTRIQRARARLKEILLQCCDFEFDSYGNIIDYHKKCDCKDEKNIKNCDSF